MKAIKAGIVGGAGYTGGELIRILLNHPEVNIEFVQSSSNAGNFLYEVHSDLIGDTELKFSAEVGDNIDVLFLCVGHGDARKFLDKSSFPPFVKIIDLSQDFRLKSTAVFEDRKFVYGLPELNKDAIKNAENIANPGCFATAIQLALLPLAYKGYLNSDVHINGTTGSTGAGQSLSVTSHFSWRNNNLSVYKAFEHQHLNEIGESLLQLQPELSATINFLPQRGNFSRGIFCTAYTECDLNKEEAVALYSKFYSEHPFVHISDKPIDLKQVVNTNKCLLHLEKFENKLLITSCIDNLLKGASGQAVQNMNLMFGFEETLGLKLKALAF